VVTGVARNEPLGRLWLGSTVERLARVLQPPLLVVRNRAHAPYRRVLVATDFSAAAHQALQTAVQLFPGSELVVYHAHAAPLSGLTGAQAPAAGLKAARKACDAFVADCGLAPQVAVRTVVEQGAVASLLPRYARAHQTDLVVLGAKGGSALRDLLLGNTAAQLLQWLPSDTLLVRDLPLDAVI
jgi:nucleotide-binding universal stress UspA family protein